MTPKRTQIWKVYLLHFDAPVSGKLHYVGMCKGDRLHYRMMEHRNGRGASLTAKAMKTGVGFSVGNVWYDGSPARETEIKNNGNFKKHCALCQAAAGKLDLPVKPAHYSPPPSSSAPTPLDGLRGSRISRY